MEVRPGYKQTEVGVIPEDWDLRQLGEVVMFLDGKRRPVKDADRAKMRGIIPYYGASGIVDYVNDYLFDEELILLGEDGENILSRNSRLAFRINGKTWVNNHAHVLKPNPDVSIGLLTDYLESLNYERFNSGTAQPKLNKQTCFGIPVALPPTKAEQEAIAEALSDADGLIESLEQLITKKRHLKQGAMQELLTGKKRLPGFSGEWEVKRLGELAVLSKTGVNPAANPATIYTHFSLPAFDAGATPVVEEGGGIGSNKFIVPNNAVLLSKLNPRIPRIWAPENIPENSVSSTEFLVLIPREVTNRNYLATLCLSPQVCYQMELHAIGTTGSHQRINPAQAMAIEIDFPTDKTEQTAIAAILTNMDAELAALESKLAKASQIKQGMMQELLSGRIRLVTPNNKGKA